MSGAKFKIGDRVVCKSLRRYEVLSVISQNNRYYVKYIDSYTVVGDNVCSWISGSVVDLDIAYYRDKKINEILNDV